MTLCIAAKAHDEKKNLAIVICFDARVESSITGSETGLKLRHLHPGWGALIAGDFARADELASVFGNHIAQHAASLDKVNLFRFLREPLAAFKRQLIEDHLQAKFGISYKDFYAEGNSHIPPNEVERTFLEISQISCGSQLLLFHIRSDRHEADIWLVDKDFSLARCENFGAIGSGAYNADSWLHFREMRSTDQLTTAIYKVYEAKKFSETAPGVGKTTHLAALRKNGYMEWVAGPGFDVLDELVAQNLPSRMAKADYKVPDKFVAAMPWCGEAWDAMRAAKKSEEPEISQTDNNSKTK